jgi:hypothetical protein
MTDPLPPTAPESAPQPEDKPWPDTIRAGGWEQHEPLVRRVLAPNPSPYTFTGTQTWIVGAGADVAVIDPGPAGGGFDGHADTNGEGHVAAIWPQWGMRGLVRSCARTPTGTIRPPPRR